MKKAVKNTIILGTIAALLVAACFVLLDGGGQEQTQSEETEIAAASVSGLQQITVRNEAGEYRVVRQGQAEYDIPELGGAAIAQGLADALFYDMGGLRGSIVAQEQSNGADFGLEDPTATVTLQGEDGEMLTLFLGRRLAVEGGGYYLTTDREGSGVYVVDEYYAQEMQRGAEAYRSMQILDFVYDSDYDALSEIAVSGPAIADILFRNTQDGFFMEQPVRHGCVQDDLMVSFLSPVTHLTADEYAGQADGSMGFDTPEYVIGLKYRGEDIRLLVGGEIGGKRYITREGSEEAYLIAEDKLDFLKTDYRQFVGRALYYRSIGDVKNITVKDAATQRSFALQENGGAYSAQEDGKTWGSEQFVPFFNLLISLERQGDAPAGKAGGDQMTITLDLKDGRQDIVVLTKAGEREYSVTVNGDCAFTTPASQVDALRGKLDEMQ